MGILVYGRLPTIPEYYRDMINSEVNLNDTPKQCCPFHRENTPSFSYSAEKNVWRCFGACHCGGDVVELHKKNYGMRSRQAAVKSLNELYRVRNDAGIVARADIAVHVNDTDVLNRIIYGRAMTKANTVERWLELDYVMSKYPVDYEELQDLVEKWEMCC